MPPHPAKDASSTRGGEAWLDDHELIRRIKNGEESALSAMMSQYRQQVFSTALQVLRFRPDAQEVTQDVFWAVWRSPDRFDTGRGALSSWLTILSRSRALDVLRRIRSSSMHRSAIERSQLDSPASQTIAQDRELLIEELLKRLSPEQCWIIRKVYFEGFTFTEVAALRATPLGTLKNRARGAIRKLRAELDQNYSSSIESGSSIVPV